MPTWFVYDFGYSWPLTWGHLLVAVCAAALAAFCAWRGWRWRSAAAAGLALWGAAGAVVVHEAIQLNEPARVVTGAFVPTGAGHVLDLGAGSGRATVGLLLARPQATVTAVDLYRGYYGIDDNTPERLRSNAARAGVDDRARVVTGDMRRLPFGPGEFDAVMSVAAIDHLDREGIEQALLESARVLKPRGQLLIVSLEPDGWVRLIMPWSMHGGYWGAAQNRQRWRERLARTGFEILEEGTRPATLWWLARKREP